MTALTGRKLILPGLRVETTRAALRDAIGAAAQRSLAGQPRLARHDRERLARMIADLVARQLRERGGAGR